jgi:iron transport multicopper oxidase
MNDETNPKLNVTAGKTYFLRIINMSGFAQFYLHIPEHNFTIIETDGVYTQPAHTNDLYLANGQRYGVLVKTHPASAKNFPILGSMDINGFDKGSITPEMQQNVTGALVYDGEAS